MIKPLLLHPAPSRSGKKSEGNQKGGNLSAEAKKYLSMISSFPASARAAAAREEPGLRVAATSFFAQPTPNAFAIIERFPVSRAGESSLSVSTHREGCFKKESRPAGDVWALSDKIKFVMPQKPRVTFLFFNPTGRRLPCGTRTR